MAGNNTNIVYVGNVAGLLSEANRNLAKIMPDSEDNNKFAEQVIVLEKARDTLKEYQEDEIYKLQKIFE